LPQRLLVVHRFPVVRYGVRRLVEEHCRELVAEEASGPDEALDRVRNGGLDLVVMGLSTDGRGGFELLKAI
jgi:DNA-binding NarL/FixJ family response regulator